MVERNPGESLEVQLARVETVLLRMEERLFGNGQPGVIEKLDRRVGDLEDSEAKGKGALGLLGFIVGVTGLSQLFQFFTHKN